MKYTSLYLLPLLWLSFSACSKKSDAPIPIDAAVVLHIDGARISEKLPWSEVKKSPWFQQATENAEGDSLFTVILNDPSQSGLNLAGNGWIFLTNKGKGAYSAFVWDLSDAKAFEALIKKTAPDAKIRQNGSNQYLAEGTMALVWNKKRVMALSDASEINRDLNSLTPGNEGDQEGSLDDIEEPFSFSADSLVQIALEIQNLKSDQKLSHDDTFADLIGNKGDVHFWFNIGKVYNNSLAGSLLSLSKLSALTEGNISTATVNFNEGAIDVESKGYVGKELEALYKKYPAKNFDENALRGIASNNMNLAFIMNYPPDGIKAFLTLLGVDGLVNNYMQEIGFSMDTFIQANGGNLFFTLSDFQVKKTTKTFEGFDGEPMTYEDEEPGGKLLFGVEVNQRPAFDKMVNVFKKLLGQANLQEGELGKVPYVIKDKWFLAGNDSAQLKTYGAQKSDPAFLDRIKGHPVGLYVNISSFLQASLTEMEESMEKSLAELSLKFWKDLTLSGGEFKNGATTSQIKISLGDPKRNSLQSLNQYLGDIARLIKEDEARRKKQWESEEVPALAD